MMKKLRDQMLVDLQLSGAKPNTQKSYLREVDNLSKYFNRSPEELGKRSSRSTCFPLQRKGLCPKEPSGFMLRPSNFYTERR